MSYEHLDICRKSYSGDIYSEQSFNRSSIESCHLMNLQFNDCTFDRSSLLCIYATGCTFSRCQFINVDLLSCNFTNCTFLDCDFSLANISDNTFSKGKFENVDFRGATIRENDFLGLIMMHISFRGSTMCLNAFRQVTVFDSEFGNCTEDYNIADKCSFVRSILNVESLGTMYGVSFSVLDEPTLLLLGEPQNIENLQVFSELVYEGFLQAKQFVQAFVFELNTSRRSLTESTEFLCEQMKKAALNGEYIPSDQLTFLFNIFKDLYRKQRLAFLAVNQILECAKEIVNQLPPDERIYEKFVLFYNHIGLLHQSLARDFAALPDWEELTQDRPIIVHFHFEHKPEYMLVSFLEACHQYVFDCQPKTLPRLLSEASGSYVAVVQLTVYTLVAFRLCTYLLAGSVKELVKLRASLTMLKRKRLPKEYCLQVVKPDSEITIPRAIAALLSGLLKKAVPDIFSNVPIKDFGEDNLIEMAENIDESTAE